jgi:hypothetical protein
MCASVFRVNEDIPWESNDVQFSVESRDVLLVPLDKEEARLGFLKHLAARLVLEQRAQRAERGTERAVQVFAAARAGVDVQGAAATPLPKGRLGKPAVQVLSDDRVLDVLQVGTVLSATSSLSGGQVERALGGARDFPLARPAAANRPDLLAPQLPPPGAPPGRRARPPRAGAPRRGGAMPD